MALISNAGPEIKIKPVARITRIPQLGDRTCWAACVEMVHAALHKQISQCNIIQHCADRGFITAASKNSCDSGVLNPDYDQELSDKDMTLLWKSYKFSPTYHHLKKKPLRDIKKLLQSKKSPIQVMIGDHYSLAVSVKKRRSRGNLKIGICLADPRKSARQNRFIWVNFIKNDTLDGPIQAAWSRLI